MSAEELETWDRCSNMYLFNSFFPIFHQSFFTLLFNCSFPWFSHKFHLDKCLIHLTVRFVLFCVCVCFRRSRRRIQLVLNFSKAFLKCLKFTVKCLATSPFAKYNKTYFVAIHSSRLLTVRFLERFMHCLFGVYDVKVGRLTVMGAHSPCTSWGNPFHFDFSIDHYPGT